MAEIYKITRTSGVADHIRVYTESNGVIGHHVDLGEFGGPPDVTCLLLKTRGRRSGEWRITPLTYAEDGGNCVVIASNGGAAKPPSWFLNLDAQSEVCFQVAASKYRGRARVAEGEERERLWQMLVKTHPRFGNYEGVAKRVIPVVVLEPEAEIDAL